VHLTFRAARELIIGAQIKRNPPKCSSIKDPLNRCHNRRQDELRLQALTDTAEIHGSGDGGKMSERNMQ
jgi:hypothetical protein